MSTWLPYTLIDQVLLATAEAEADGSLSERARNLCGEMQVEIENRMKKMQRLSQHLWDSRPKSMTVAAR